jgi:hypothetical protein
MLNLSLVLGEGGLDGLGVGADDGLDLSAVLEEDKGGHGTDSELLGDVGDLVDVDLVEADVLVIGLGVSVERRKKCQSRSEKFEGGLRVIDEGGLLEKRDFPVKWQGRIVMRSIVCSFCVYAPSSDC